MTGVLDGVQLHLVDSMDQLDNCRRWLSQRRDYLGIDTESAGLNVYRHPHRLTQIGDLNSGWSFPPEWFGAANEMITRYDGEMVMFNSPYDMRVLSHWQNLAPRWERTHDAQLAGHLIDSSVRNSLKGRSAREVDPRAIHGEKALSDAMAAHGWDWATVPVRLPQYWAYGAVDPVLTAHMMAKFSPEITARYSAAYDLERSYARLAAAMMSAGLLTDQAYINEWISKISAWTADALAWLRHQWGVLSVSSNEQVGRALELAGVAVRYTGTGKPEINKDAMAAYAVRHPHAAELISTLRGARKGQDIVGRFLTKFLDMADASGVLHYSIHTIGAHTTSRSSITDPAMQTFDRDVPMIRGALIPRPGHVLISIDASQIEARLMAHFSRDPQMIADFLEADATGGHFFLTMASKIYGEQISKKDQRYSWTKNVTYAQFYGSGMETAAATAHVPLEQMRPVYEGLRTLYPRVGAYMDRVVRENKRPGHRPQCQTLWGRTLYGQRGKEYALVDYRIQGSAAELLKAGAVNIDAAGMGHMLRLPIHDELLLEAPADQAEEVLRACTEILTDRDNFAVPILWEGAILPERWAKT